MIRGLGSWTFLMHTMHALIWHFSVWVVHSSFSFFNSNPVVQRQALALDCLNTLIRCLLPTDDSESDTLQRRALFAISNILRHNFDAQHYFTVTLEGVNAVGKDLENSSTKYQLKALVLLTDILTELVCPPPSHIHIHTLILGSLPLQSMHF